MDCQLSHRALVTLARRYTMTTRNLSRRLQRLEASTVPATEAKDITIRFLSSEDGRVVSTLRIDVPSVPPLPFKKTRPR